MVLEDAAYFAEKARWCRRLLRTSTDPGAIESLTALAKEFDATAKAIEAFTYATPHLADDVHDRHVPDDRGDPK